MLDVRGEKVLELVLLHFEIIDRLNQSNSEVQNVELGQPEQPSTYTMMKQPIENAIFSKEIDTLFTKDVIDCRY